LESKWRWEEEKKEKEEEEEEMIIMLYKRQYYLWFDDRLDGFIGLDVCLYWIYYNCVDINDGRTVVTTGLGYTEIAEWIQSIQGVENKDKENQICRDQVRRS